MKRSMAGLSSLLVCAIAVAGCSSSGSGKGSTTTITDAPVVTTPEAPIAQTACSFVPAPKLKALLGASPAGVESDQQNTYKTCTWTGGGSKTAANTLSLGVIRIGNGEVGFGASSVQGLTSKVVKGLGTKATYSVGKSASTGLNEAVLNANNATVSVSITLKYSGTIASLQSRLTAIVRSIFQKLKA